MRIKFSLIAPVLCMLVYPCGRACAQVAQIASPTRFAIAGDRRNLHLERHRRSRQLLAGCRNSRGAGQHLCRPGRRHLVHLLCHTHPAGRHHDLRAVVDPQKRRVADAEPVHLYSPRCYGGDAVAHARLAVAGYCRNLHLERHRRSRQLLAGCRNSIGAG